MPWSGRYGGVQSTIELDLRGPFQSNSVVLCGVIRWSWSTSFCKTPFCSWYVGLKSHFIICPSLDHTELSLTNNLCNRLYFSLEQALVGSSPFNSMWCYWKNAGLLFGTAVSIIYPLLRVKPPSQRKEFHSLWMTLDHLSCCLFSVVSFQVTLSDLW